MSKGIMDGALFSHKTDMWETPQDLFDKLNAVHHFNLDVCAVAENAKCKNYFTPEQDGLSQKWGGYTCWCNPPYGRQIAKWVKKAYESNCKVVMLLPARTDTAWFHDYCLKGQVEFIRGRIKFGGSTQPAPFPSMIVIFDKHKEGTEMEQLTFDQLFSGLTPDYIREILGRGSGVENGKQRITKFFKQESDLTKRAEMLKNEYGIGGVAYKDDDGVSHHRNYDAKGIEIQRNDDKVLLKWDKVAKIIGELIDEGIYGSIEGW